MYSAVRGQEVVLTRGHSRQVGFLSLYSNSVGGGLHFLKYVKIYFKEHLIFNIKM